MVIGLSSKIIYNWSIIIINMVSTKKTDDLNKILDGMRKKGENKQCFDCGEKVFNLL